MHLTIISNDVAMHASFAGKVIQTQSSFKMSEFWERKMKTLFHRLDFDKDGLISKSDFELMAQRFGAAGKLAPVKQQELEKNFCYVS